MRHLYPPPAEWKKLRDAVLKRALNRCECRGECGARHAGGGACLVRNGLIAARSVVDGEERWREHHHSGGCCVEPCEDTEPPGTKVVTVVLTIAHRDHKPENNALENLAAFCQRCHLRYDRAEHAKNAAATRAQKAGQRGLF